MSPARVAEQDEDPGRATFWRRRRGLRQAGADVRRVGAYLRRAAARRAIQRMLYWASRNVTKSIERIPIVTQKMVRLASSPAGSGKVLGLIWLD